MNYQDFIDDKSITAPVAGLCKIPPMPAAMKQFQADITTWALRRGRAAIFAGTGLGKTYMQTIWAREVMHHTSGDVLILTPLAVADQTVREAAKFGIDGVAYAKDKSAITTPITVTNYDRLEKFDPARFVAVVLDECFAKGTLVDTPTGKKHIENILEGEYILNAAGVDAVVKTHKREVTGAIKVTTGTTSFIASTNHPVFTQRGWVAARDLRAGDYALETAAAMRLVRNSICAAEIRTGCTAFLQQVLFSELADEHAGTQSKSAHARSSSQTWGDAFGVVKVRRSTGQGSSRENPQPQSNARSECAKETICDTTRAGPQAFQTWWQWPSADTSANSVVENIGQGLGGGVSDISRRKEGRLSNQLQGRYCAFGAEDCYRGGWSQSSIEEKAGPKKRSNAGFVRVDSVEVLELGHPELDRCRDADGKLYFYDIEAERHPSFSVNGLLVHNSSIIKAVDSKTRIALLDAFSQTPWRLACTATPAPNDYVELGNHAEFLGVMTQKEMLSMFFVHDGSIRAHGGSDWRLKRHATADFWAWLASWAVVIRSPRDLGYDEPGYDLPPLHKKQITVSVPYGPSGDTLFPIAARTLSERISARRDSIDVRVQAAKELVRADPDKPWLIWCGLNDEQDTLRDIFGNSCVSIRGSDHPDTKVTREQQWRFGNVPILLTKPSIFGYGMNWQHCSNMMFVGLNDSFEQLFQAIRRCWRFGQNKAVNVYMIASELEGAVVENLNVKEREFERMCDAMAGYMADLSRQAVRGGRIGTSHYKPQQQMDVPAWLS